MRKEIGHRERSEERYLKRSKESQAFKKGEKGEVLTSWTQRSTKKEGNESRGCKATAVKKGTGSFKAITKTGDKKSRRSSL